MMIKLLEVGGFFGFLLVGDLERLDLVEGGFVIEFDGLDLLFEASIFLFEYEALVLKEGQFVSQLSIIFVSLDFDIDVPVGFLGEDQIVAHRLQDVHEGTQEVLLLFGLEVRGQFIQDLYLLDDE